MDYNDFLEHQELIFEIRNSEEYKNINPEETEEFKKFYNNENLIFYRVNVIQGLPNRISNYIKLIKVEPSKESQKKMFVDAHNFCQSILDKELSDEYLESKRLSIIDQINDYKKYIKVELDKFSREYKTNKPSYKWQGKQDEDLPELYKLMKDEYKLISKNTTYNQFKAIFTEQQLENIKPIKWHDDNASEVIYFIIKLGESENIEFNKRTDYKKLIACFVTSNGTAFSQNLKSLRQRIEMNLSKAKQDIINQLINEF